MIEPSLPDAFGDLERFVDHWVLDTSQERVARRSETPMAEIQEFYDALLPRGPEILTWFDDKDLTHLAPDAERLYKLLLSLAHAAMAIEVHGQQRAPNSPWPNNIRIERCPQPYGYAQP